jgi:hypothetical protein
MTRFPIVAVGAVLLAAGCTDTTVTPDPVGTLQVVNAASSAGSIVVYSDGQAVGGAIVPGTGASRDIPTGSHDIELRSSAGVGFSRTVQFVAGQAVIVVGLDSAGRVAPTVLADTGAIVPAGATKLRVAHMASAAAPISIWRTQPDYGTMIRVQFPFPYRAVSPYLQSTPGDWRVMVSSEDNTAATVPMPDTLANSGLIAVGAGTSRTVVIVNGVGGGVAVVVVDP